MRLILAIYLLLYVAVKDVKSQCTIPTLQMTRGTQAGNEGDSLELTFDFGTCTVSAGNDYTLELTYSHGDTSDGDYISFDTLNIPTDLSFFSGMIQLVDDCYPEDTESFTVALSAITSAAPQTQTIVLTGVADELSTVVTIEDNDTIITSLSPEVISYNENDSAGTVTVSLEFTGCAENTGDFEQRIAVMDGSNFTFTSTVIPADSTGPLLIPITVTDDDIVEDDKEFTVLLLGVTGPNTLTRTDAIQPSDASNIRVTIDDDDTVSVGIEIGTSYSEGMTVPVVLTYDKPVEDFGFVIELDFSGSAEGDDYSAAFFTVTMGTGISSETFSMSLIDDDRTECDETVILSVSTVSAPADFNRTDAIAIGAMNVSTFTIEDNDDATLGTNSNLSASESDVVLTPVLHLSNIIDDVGYSATISLVPDKAIFGDFESASTVVSIPTGILEFTFPVTIYDDDLVEDDETFSLFIIDVSSPCRSDAISVAANDILTVTIEDEDTSINTATELEIVLMDVIHTLSRGNVTTEEVEEAAEAVEEASRDDEFVREDSNKVELVVSSLEAVVNAGESSVEVTDPVVRVVNNLINVDEEILEESMVNGGRVVAALEKQLMNFQTSKGNFTRVLENVGVAAVKIDPAIIGSSLAYANVFPENTRPSTEGALREENTQIFLNGGAVPLERTATSIAVPSTVLESLGEAGIELTEVPVSFVIYSNDALFRPSMDAESGVDRIEDDNSTLTERVVSQIISAIIRTEDTNVVRLPPDSHVITKFITNLTVTINETVEGQDCVVWSYDENTGEGFWTKDGCERMSDDYDLTVCSCDRLGSFTILIRVRRGSIEAQVALYFITLIGSIISCLALIGCLITFVSLRSFRTKQPTQIHINLCVSLLGFYIAFLLSPLAVGNKVACTVASVAIHFFCLATSAWMSSEAVNMFYLFLKAERRSYRHFIPISCLLAYGLPAACVLLVVFLDKNTNFETAGYCFINPGYALYFGFLAEIGVMFMFNFVIFISVIRKILCRPLMVTSTNENAKRNEIIKRVRHGVLFWFVLGLSWIFGFLAAVDNKTLIFAYLYCIFISVQGILMFLLLCVANPEFRKKFKKTDSKKINERFFVTNAINITVGVR